MAQEGVSVDDSRRLRAVVILTLAYWWGRSLRMVRAIAFWFAIVSPLVLVGAIAAGLGRNRPIVFFGVLGLSVCATLLGSGHRRGIAHARS